MKSYQSLIVYCLFLFFAHTQSATANEYASGEPNIVVNVKDELEVLSNGYAQAFAKMPNGPRYIYLQLPNGKATECLTVTSLESVDGVLLAKSSEGPSYILNPKKILLLTNKKVSSLGE